MFANPPIKVDDFRAADVEMDVDNPDFKLFDEQPLSPIHITTYHNSNNSTPVTTRNKQDTFAAPKPIGDRKRKLSNDPKPGSSKNVGASTSTGTTNVTIPAANSSSSISDVSKGDNSNKIRRVQTKFRSQINSSTSNNSGLSLISGNNVNIKHRAK